MALFWLLCTKPGRRRYLRSARLSFLHGPLGEVPDLGSFARYATVTVSGVSPDIGSIDRGHLQGAVHSRLLLLACQGHDHGSGACLNPHFILTPLRSKCAALTSK